MKKFIKEYFSFNKRDRNAIIVLLILITILVLSKYLNFLDLSKKDFDYSNFENEVKEFEKSIKIDDNNYSSIASTKINYFNFDPNIVNKKTWIELGLNEKQINTLNKYLQKGGKFYKKEDLKKIYGIDLETYKNLEPFIVIDTSILTKRIRKKSIYYFDLNSIDSIQLAQIKNLDRKLSARIVKYRMLLGGFVEKSQLKEIYGINENLYQEIEKMFYVDTSEIQKINLNTIKKYNLQKHPYIHKYEAEAIISYREFKGRISNFNELIDNNILKSTDLNRLRPYIKLE